MKMTAGGGALLLSAPSVRAQSRKPVTYYATSVFTDARLFATATTETNLDIKFQNFGNEDQSVARLAATRGAGLDVMNITNNLTNQLSAAGYFHAIDVSRLKNWNKIYPELREASFVKSSEPGKALGVPMSWGPEALIYRTDKIPSASSWTDLWDPKWKGRIAVPDYGYEMLFMAAQVLGYNEAIRKEPVEFTDEQYAAIKRKLIEQKPLVTKYWGSAVEGASLIASGEAWISVGRLAMLRPMRDEKIPFRILNPKEGAHGWCNLLCILANSTNIDAAYELIDWMIADGYQQSMATIRNILSVNKGYMESLPFESRNVSMLGDPNLLNNLVWWRRAGDPQRVNNLWNEVKAS